MGFQLGTDGSIARWGDWMPVDWFSWFNQGAGIAVADLNGDGKLEVVIFQIDNPPGENAGFYLSEVLPVHAALLHTRKVLFFAGSWNNAFRAGSPRFGNVQQKVYTSVVWDPTKGVFDNQTFVHLRRCLG